VDVKNEAKDVSRAPRKHEAARNIATSEREEEKEGGEKGRLAPRASSPGKFKRQGISLSRKRKEKERGE
jgi:hypothetical protein